LWLWNHMLTNTWRRSASLMMDNTRRHGSKNSTRSVS
jgi:hypothetical protein